MQRLRIARELSRKTMRDTLYLLDEPSAGLHLADIEKLLSVLRRLTEAGASVLIVEHNLDILVACDWLIEMGPGGGPSGGKIVAPGTPESVARTQTATAPYLKLLLG